MSTLEDRLAAALSARAEQVTPEDLAPQAPPTSVASLRSRVRPSVYVVLAAAAAAAVVVAVSSGGGTERRTIDPAPTSTPTPSALPTRPAPATPSRVQRQVPVALPTGSGGGAAEIVRADTGEGSALGYGGSATLQDGTTVSLEGPPAVDDMVDAGQARLVVTADGISRTFVFDAGPAPQVETTPVLFDSEGPVGYLVTRPQGGDYLAATLVLDQGSELVALETKDETEGAPASPFSLGFAGGESGWDTFVSNDGTGLFTAYVVPGQPVGQVTLVRWGITGPAARPQLTTTSLGTRCVDDPTGPTSYTRC